VELLIERIAERHDALGQILVVLVLDGKGHQLWGDRSEFDGLIGEALRGFPNLRVLHLPGADGANDLRHHSGF
jgi:hypothetical protein